jgi:exopolysaccharide biosynthesis polyprenyl glycosylphosphotransferase
VARVLLEEPHLGYRYEFYHEAETEMTSPVSPPGDSTASPRVSPIGGVAAGERFTTSERGSPGRAIRRSGPRARSLPAPVMLRPDVQVYLRLCRLLDTFGAPALLLLVFLATNYQSSLSWLQEFLAIRVTVKNLLYVLAFAVAWRLVCHLWGLYDWRRVRTSTPEFARLLGACTTGSAMALIFPAISVTGAFRPLVVLEFWVGSVLALAVLRGALRRLVLWQDREAREVLIVGTGPRALQLYEHLSDGADSRVRVAGFVDGNVWSAEHLPQGLFLGQLQELESLLMRRAVDEVLIALPIKSRYQDVQDVLQICERVGVRAKYLADVFQHPQAETRFGGEGAVPVITILMAPDDYRLLIKRVIDLLVAGAGLIALAPLMLASAAAIKITSPGPVFFVQDRYGFNRRRFKMLKFRTMVNGADALQGNLEHLNQSDGPTFKIRNDPRVTRLGRWLRRTSIDELPQLINVCRGEMSLVGPRPLPERDVHRFPDAALMRRFSARPGLTCLWQISGRSELTFDDWIALDLRYIDEWSLALDLKILFQTIPVVLRGRGAM